MTVAVEWVSSPGDIQQLVAWDSGTSTGELTGGKWKCNMNGENVNIAASSGWKNQPTQLAVQYLLVQAVEVVDWGGAVDTETELFDINGGNLLLFAVRVGAGGWKLRVKDASSTLATGTTTYAWSATTHDIRLRHNNSSADGYDYVEVNGTKEITGVNIGSLGTVSTAVQLKTSNISANAAHYIQCGLAVKACADTDQERPSRTLETDKITPTAAGHHSGFTAVFPALTNTWDDVDDWSGGGSDDGNSTYVDSPSTVNTTFRLALATGNPTFTNTIRALAILVAYRLTVDAKTITRYIIHSDGTNDNEAGSLGTTQGVDWRYGRGIYNFAPDGTAWDSTDANNEQIGMRADIGADAVALRLTAIEGVFISWNDDPDGDIPVASGAAPKASPAIMAGVGVF